MYIDIVYKFKITCKILARGLTNTSCTEKPETFGICASRCFLNLSQLVNKLKQTCQFYHWYQSRNRQERLLISLYHLTCNWLDLPTNKAVLATSPRKNLCQATKISWLMSWRATPSFAFQSVNIGYVTFWSNLMWASEEWQVRNAVLQDSKQYLFPVYLTEDEIHITKEFSIHLQKVLVSTISSCSNKSFKISLDATCHLQISYNLLK